MATVSFVTETSLGSFLAALASPDNPHGTVSTAAFASAMGTSLLLKAAALPKTRSDSADDRRVLFASAAALRDVQEQLIETIETETAIRVFAASRMPEGSGTERKERVAALQVALRAAADVPLEVMRLCVAALTHAERVAAHSCQAASRNVHLAVALLRVGFDGARVNLESKLNSLTDASYTTAVIDEIPRLSEEATTKARTAEELMRLPAA
ncbi:MAG TPA: cyclodeaminase/cyclohydrolase family protein [Vicinamibacterales bacterium]|jgi:formiminotetrahydrofolate cyclodeaminase|nr:cyclodeaminase/cyclohydrolase family protein [Vicinamibacterales bacterium]